ncbi:uncharacterized protein [Rutidosis leptorrhynchoides]|uniref:uncharacterized protein isoform X2 n=1 Tax=Rutidosis leptorrhynchoides TaxID=125765 RepID=UPI003A98E861
MAKKKDESTTSVSKSDDASCLRRSTRGTPTKNQTTQNHSNTRKSERFEKQTSPNPSPVKQKSETQIGPSPLRRSDRGKKLAGVSDIPNSKSANEKSSNSSKQSAEDINEGIKDTSQNSDVGDRKRKRFSAYRYKSLQGQRVSCTPDMYSLQNIDAENPEGSAKSSQINTSGNKGSSDKDKKMLLVESVMDSEHVGCPSQTRQLDGKSTGSGSLKTQNSGSCSPSSSRINLDTENQMELDSRDKVMENAENNDTQTNNQNSKFVEFWVPVQISNMQLEQYCANLLSNAMFLRSCSKTDTLGSLKEILDTNMKCCNHPYLVDPSLEKHIMKDYEQSMQLDVGVKTSGKLQFLDLILPEIQKRQLKVLILFQSTSGTSIGNILDDFVLRRFGQESYVCVDGKGPISSTNKLSLHKYNKETGRYILLLESRACNPSIKLSSVDMIIIYDSDLIPTNDLKALQKLHMDSNSEQIMILRLYSSSTLEEKVLKLAEQNVSISIRPPNLRSNYDALLTWGVSNLFQRLNEFHTSSNRNISSEDSLLRDVMDEILYLISHKCKINDASNSIISRIQNFGSYAKHTEIKSRLTDVDQPYVFWRKVFEGQNPVWKFLPDSTPRQRKRPSYFLGSSEENGGVKSRRRTVNGQSKVVNEWNEGGSSVPAHNESQSSSGDQFWSTAIVNDASIHDIMKPTVFELCNVLKFTEDVKITVGKFLEFVLEKFRVSKEHTSTLQALMISLCWTGSALAKNDIDRRESFAIAKKHFKFCCREDETEEVYKKLQPAKESFLQHTDIFDSFKDPVTKNVDSSECNESSNEKEANKCNSKAENVCKKERDEIEKYNEEWEEARLKLVKGYSADEAVIRFLYNKNPSLMSEKIKRLDQEFAKKLEEHEKMRETKLKDLESKLLAAEKEHSVRGSQHEIIVVPSENPEVGPTLLDGNTNEAQSVDISDVDGADDVASKSSYTSEKQNADATSASVSVGEIQDDHMEDDVAKDDAVTVSEKIGEFQYQQRDDDVSGKVSLVDTQVPEVNTSQQQTADVAPHGDIGQTETPAGNCNEESVEEMLAIIPYTPRADVIVNETIPDDVAPHGDSEMPAGNCSKDNVEESIISPDTSHSVAESQPIDENHTDYPTVNWVLVDQSTEPTVDERTVDERTVNETTVNEPTVNKPTESQPMDENQSDIPTVNWVLVDQSTEPTVSEPTVNEQTVKETTINEMTVDETTINEMTVDETTINKLTESQPMDENQSYIPRVNWVLVDQSTEPTVNEPTDNELTESQPMDENQSDIPTVNWVLVDQSTEPTVNEMTVDEPTESQPMDENRSDIPTVNWVLVDQSTEPTANERTVNEPTESQPMDENQSDIPTVNWVLVDQSTEPTVNEPTVNEPTVKETTVDEMTVNEMTVNEPTESQPMDENQSNTPTVNWVLDDQSTEPTFNEPTDNEPTVKETTTVNEMTVNEPTVDEPNVNESNVNEPTVNEPNVNGSNVNVNEPNANEPTVNELTINEPTVNEPIVNESNVNEPNVNVNEPNANEPTVNEPPVNQLNLPSSDAQTPPVNPLDMFDSINLMGSFMPNTDPLHLEVERLNLVNNNVINLHEETKRRLKLECEKEIAEMIAQIRSKYEAKHQQALVAFYLKKNELERNLSRVLMNKMLAEAFRSKCQDLHPFRNSGIRQASPAGLMQELHRLSHPSSMTWSNSPGQTSRPWPNTLPPLSQPQTLAQIQAQAQTQPTPRSGPQQSQPPLQIVHQPSALFSNTPNRLPPTSNHQSPSITPIIPPPPPPPNLTTTRSPPIINSMSPSGMQNRSPFITNQTDMSAANLRINTETRRQPSHTPAPHIKPVLNSGDIRPPTQHIRPASNGDMDPQTRVFVRNQIRSLAPHTQPGISNEARATGPQIRAMVPQIRTPAPHIRAPAPHMRGPAPHMRPFRSTSPLPTSMPPSQHAPSSLPLTSNSQLPLSTSLSQPLPEVVSVVPATSATPTTTVHDLTSQLDVLNVTDYNIDGDGTPLFPGPSLVYLSDDD